MFIDRRRAITLTVGGVTSIGLVALIAACSVLSHANDYAVSASTELCRECSSTPNARIPCAPKESAGPDTGETYVYALESLSFGADYLIGPTYHAGRDLDCSDRKASHGEPVACKMPPSGEDIDLVPWSTPAHGIDNAFGTIYMRYFFDRGAPTLEENINASIGKTWGLVLVVKQWNALPDDPEVAVQLYPATIDASERENPVPARDRRWRVVGQFGLSGKAYVSAGRLVWDARKVDGGELWMRNGDAGLVINVSDLALDGSLTPDGFHDVALSGKWPTGTEHGFNKTFLSGCDPTIARDLEAKAGFTGDRNTFSRVDLPTIPGGPICNAVSLGFALEFGRASGVEIVNTELARPTDCTIDTASDAGAADANVIDAGSTEAGSTDASAE